MKTSIIMQFIVQHLLSTIKTSGSIIAVTIVGVVFAVILTTLVLLNLSEIIDFIAIVFPPETYPAEDTNPTWGIYPFGLGLGPNFGRYLLALVFYPVLVSCLASLIAGFLLDQWRKKINSYTWQSLIPGVIIGLSSAFTLEMLMERPSWGNSLTNILMYAIYGLVAAISGLIGYRISGKIRYDRGND